jgi:hypothetical protein
MLQGPVRDTVSARSLADLETPDGFLSQGRQGPAGQCRPSPAMAKSTKRIAFGAEQPSTFRLP